MVLWLYIFLKETLSFRDVQNDIISRIYFNITPQEAVGRG